MSQKVWKCIKFMSTLEVQVGSLTIDRTGFFLLKKTSSREIQQSNIGD